MNYSTGWKAGTMAGIRHRSIFTRGIVRYRPASKIIRRGRVLEDGSILWIQDGKLSIEKKGN